MGGFIGPGREKIREMRVCLLYCMCDAAEQGVQLCQEAVCSDHGGECSPIVVERCGRLAVPLVAQTIPPHPEITLTSGVSAES